MASSEYIDENKVVVEIRPRWSDFYLRMGILLILLIFAGCLAMSALYDYSNPRPGPGTTSDETPAGKIIIFFVIFIPSGSYLALHVFWLLRGRWSLRITPKALLCRGWLSVFEIPWDRIARIPVPDDPPVLTSASIIKITITAKSQIQSAAPFRISWDTEEESPVQQGRLEVRQSWIQHDPLRLARILEKYRLKFSGTA
jgi:hypothetical protein